MNEVIQSPNRKIPQTYHEPEPIKHSLKMFEISTSVGEPGGRKRGPLCSLTAWCRASERWRPPKGGIPGIKNIIFCFFVPKRKKKHRCEEFQSLILVYRMRENHYASTLFHSEAISGSDARNAILQAPLPSSCLDPPEIDFFDAWDFPS